MERSRIVVGHFVVGSMCVFAAGCGDDRVRGGDSGDDGGSVDGGTMANTSMSPVLGEGNSEFSAEPTPLVLTYGYFKTFEVGDTEPDGGTFSTRTKMLVMTDMVLDCGQPLPDILANVSVYFYFYGDVVPVSSQRFQITWLDEDRDSVGFAVQSTDSSSDTPVATIDAITDGRASGSIDVSGARAHFADDFSVFVCD
jgi:hypothetical protein